MPAKFVKCVREGGRVRTIKPRPDVYIHICYPKGGGEPVAGEVHHLTRSGLGVSGRPRRGRPKTEAERRATHRLLHRGRGKLPPRGTGLKRRGYLARELERRK